MTKATTEKSQQPRK